MPRDKIVWNCWKTEGGTGTMASDENCPNAAGKRCRHSNKGAILLLCLALLKWIKTPSCLRQNTSPAILFVFWGANSWFVREFLYNILDMLRVLEIECIFLIKDGSLLVYQWNNDARTPLFVTFSLINSAGVMTKGVLKHTNYIYYKLKIKQARLISIKFQYDIKF